jgi:putative transposase
MKKDDLKDLFSYGFVRNVLQRVDKLKAHEQLLGLMYAKQLIRAIKRLHSNFAGFRTELDHTKYAEFLYPSEDWNEPLMYYNGFGIDDHSSVIKGFTYTTAPSTRDVVRLYRNCVLPKSMWLRESLRHFAADWDAYGLEVIVAIDKGPDFVSYSTSLMFLANGSIILRMPSGMGDMKGSSERTHQTMEQTHVSKGAGYVPREYTGIDPRYKRIRERAKAKANRTVAEREAEMVAAICDHNGLPHPTLRKPRIRVFRDSQEAMPLMLPTGLLQLRTTFALTFTAKLLREGVEVDGLKFNSEELGEVFRTYSGDVVIKMDPDDVRQVLVFVPRLDRPVLADLTTFNIPFQMSLELLKTLLQRLASRGNDGDESWILDPDAALLSELEGLRGSSERTPGRTARSDAQAATHAVQTPVPAAPPAPRSEAPSLESMLGGSRIDVP